MDSDRLIYFLTLGNEDVSVNMDTKAISEELSRRGYKITVAPSRVIENGSFKQYVYADMDADNIVNIHYPAHYSSIQNIGRKSILWSVNDTTRFSDYWREMWLMKGYKNFVVHNPLQYAIMNMPKTHVIPDPVFPPENKIQVRPFGERDYTFFVHNDSPIDRRGYLEAMQVIKHFNIKNNIYHSRHIPVPEGDEEYFTHVMTNSSQEDLYNAIGSCKFLLYMTKGGAFERLVLEALAVGTVPIITEVGSASQILLDRDDGVLIPAIDHYYGMFHNEWQQGFGIQPSVELGLPMIEKALNTKYKINYKRYRKFYGIERIGDLWEQVISS